MRAENLEVMIVDKFIVRVNNPPKRPWGEERLMVSETVIEARLTKLENAVAELQRQATVAPQKEDWLDAITGSITDEEAFLEALKYGREFRESDKPTPPSGPKS